VIERKDLTGRMVYCEYGTYGKEKSMKQERIIPYDKAIRGEQGLGGGNDRLQRKRTGRL
jgi:hypothetical protein